MQAGCCASIILSFSGVFQLEHLNYNTQTPKSAFCSYMHGLRRKLEKMPRKKAQAITSELLAYLLDDILNNEPHKYLALRDVIVLALGFLLGLRAVDISVVNTDSVKLIPDLVPNNCSFDVVVSGGKQTKTLANRYTVVNSAVPFDIYEVMSRYLEQTLEFYKC